MSYDLGTATGRIEIDYDGKGVTQAEKDVEGLQSKTDKSTGSLNKIGNTAGVAGLAIAGGLAVAVNSAADFEARMSAIKAVSGATGSEFEGLRDKALQLGKDTSFSAGEAALAIEELAKAGIKVPDILNGAADATTALAAAGEISLPEAATIASNAMNQFGLKAKEMPGVADLFAGAANTSAIGVSDIGQALQQVGAVANLAGVSLEDTTTAIGLMGNAGIAGSDAGTSLKSMFARMIPTTDAASNALQRMGIITEDGTNKFYDAQGNMKSMSDIAGLLGRGLDGMSQKQKQATLQTVFGADAIRAAAILAKNGSKGFDEFANSVGKVSAADVAKTRLDNFQGSLEQMKGSLETAGIAIGTVLLPYLRQLVDMVTGALNAFLNLDEGTQKIIVAVIAAVGALLLIIAAVAKLTIFISAAQAAIVGLGPAFAAVGAALGPILLIAAAIAALVVAVILLWKHSETFRAGVMAVWAQIQQAIQAFVDFFVGQVWPQVKSIIDLLLQAWRDLTTGTGGALGAIRTIVQTWMGFLLTIMKVGWDLIKGVVMGVWTALKGIIMGAMSVIKGIINVVMGIIKGDWSQVWLGIKQIFSGVWTAIKGILSGALQVIKAILSAAWSVIKAGVSAAWNTIKAIISGVWNVIKSLVVGAVKGINNAIDAAWNWVVNTTQNLWNSVSNAVSNGVDRAVEFVRGLPGKIQGFFSDAGSWLIDAGEKIIQGLIDGIGNMVDAAQQKVRDVVGGIRDLLPGSPVKTGPLTVLNQGHAGKEIMRMLIGGIDSEAWNLARAVSDVAGMLPAGLPAVNGNGGTIRQPRRGQGGQRHTRLVGSLKLVDGRAYIEGIAEDVDDGDDDYDDTLGRMN